jgi:hypothetical protein
MTNLETAAIWDEEAFTNLENDREALLDALRRPLDLKAIGIFIDLGDCLIVQATCLSLRTSEQFCSELCWDLSGSKHRLSQRMNERADFAIY